MVGLLFPYSYMCYKLTHLIHFNGKNIWHNTRLINPNYLSNFGDESFEIWLDKNLNHKESDQLTQLDWNTLFAATLWNIWKGRNEFQFSNCAINHNQIAIKSRVLAKDIQRAFDNNVGQINSSNTRLINWKFPLAGTLKINTDGSLSQEERGSYGGLVRDDQGKWIEGFCGNIGWSTVIKAELWAIRYALHLCDERNWECVPIETDCLSAVKLILGEVNDDHHPDRVLIEDCRKMIKELKTEVVHVLREANKCADELAKLGGEQSERQVCILVPPEDMIEDLRADQMGTAYERGM